MTRQGVQRGKHEHFDGEDLVAGLAAENSLLLLASRDLRMFFDRVGERDWRGDLMKLCSGRERRSSKMNLDIFGVCQCAKGS